MPEDDEVDEDGHSLATGVSNLRGLLNNVLCCVTNIWAAMIRTSAVAASKCCTLLQLVGGCRPVMHPPLAHTNPELTSVCFNGIALNIIQYTIKLL